MIEEIPVRINFLVWNSSYEKRRIKRRDMGSGEWACVNETERFCWAEAL